MNVSHGVSRMLVVMLGFCLASEIHAGDTKEKTNSKTSPFSIKNLNARVSQELEGNVFKILTAVYTAQHCKHNEHLRKAALRTLGKAFDDAFLKLDENDKYQLDVVNLVAHGGADLLIQKASEYAHEKGISVDTLSKQCKKLPEAFYIQDFARLCIETTGNIVTDPQFILYVLSKYLPDSNTYSKYTSSSGA